MYTYALDYNYYLPQPVLVFEYIEGARTLTKFIQRNYQTSFVSKATLDVVIQVINALNLAYQHYKFTHYDLRTDNILVKEVIRGNNDSYLQE